MRTTKFGKFTFRYEAAVVWNRLPNKLPKVKDFAEFLLSFESIGHSVQEKTFKLNFQDNSRGGHLGFLIGTILAIFLSASHPDTSYPVSSQLAFWFRKKKFKIDF